MTSQASEISESGDVGGTEIILTNQLMCRHGCPGLKTFHAWGKEKRAEKKK